MAYDENNIFARILRGEIPCSKVYENDYAIAFHDTSPLMPVHVLVVPKGAYVDMEDFSQYAGAAEMAGWIRAIGETARIMGVEETGYRLVANTGPQANQEVQHLHVHVFGGRQITGRMVKSD